MKFFKLVLEVLQLPKTKKEQRSQFASSSTERFFYSAKVAQKDDMREAPLALDTEKAAAFDSFLESFPSSDFHRFFKEILGAAPDVSPPNFSPRRLLPAGLPTTAAASGSPHEANAPKKTTMSVDEAIDHAFGPIVIKTRKDRRNNSAEFVPASPAPIMPEEKPAVSAEAILPQDIVAPAGLPDHNAIAAPVSASSIVTDFHRDFGEEVRRRKNDEFARTLSVLLGENPDIYHAAVITNDGHVLAQKLASFQAYDEDENFNDKLIATGLALVKLRRAIRKIAGLGELNDAIIQSAKRTTMFFDIAEHGVLETTARPNDNLGMIMLDSREAAQKAGMLWTAFLSEVQNERHSESRRGSDRAF